jgi:hypothetical protein
MNDLWKTFHLIPDKQGLNDKQQIQYWKYSYHKAMGMFEDCAENYIEQLDFHRAIIKDLRTQIKEMQSRVNS